VNKKELKAYLDRWDLVREIEARELREASPELLVRQMLSIWQFNWSLGFSDPNTLPDNSWSNLQKKWMERRG
jgi:hypothetical protein